LNFSKILDYRNGAGTVCRSLRDFEIKQTHAKELCRYFGFSAGHLIKKTIYDDLSTIGVPENLANGVITEKPINLDFTYNNNGMHFRPSTLVGSSGCFHDLTNVHLECSEQFRKIQGKWSIWSSWSECKMTNHYSTRFRRCLANESKYYTDPAECEVSQKSEDFIEIRNCTEQEDASYEYEDYLFYD